ncbi:MAG: CBS domain-containing protein [Candidatus Marsarchaeota archaeon]|nr:CBS domain-containing protein [Candidatus Marsarchaeota archaeon]
MVRLRINYVPQELATKTISLSSNEPITKIIPMIKDKKYEGVIINKNNKYLGIIDSKGLYKFSDMRMQKNESAEGFVVKAPVINNETDLFTVLDYFTSAKTNVLPYSYKNKIDSVLTRKSLLKLILSSKLMNEMPVERIMTFPVIAADADTGLITAKKIMSDHKLSRLVVLKNNSPIGIISMKDIIYKFSLNEKLPEMKDVRFNINNINIGSLCERNVKTIEYNRPVSEAMRRIIEQAISSLVVVKDKKYIGMVTISDILKNIQINEQIQENKIFLIGIDEETKEYEDEIREQLKSEINKIERMNYTVNYLTLNVKRNNRYYQLNARINLDRTGIISLHVEEYLLDKAMKNLLSLLEKELKKEKSQMLTLRKVDRNEEE